MQNRVLAMASAVGFLLPLLTPTHGTPYISNLDQTPTGSVSVGSDSWVAQGFALLVTDSNTYSLNSIDLRMDQASGDPSGFSVSLFSSPLGSGGGPRALLGNLEGPSDPLTGGVYTYTAANITIQAHEFYHVVVTATAPIAQGAYSWSMVEGGMGSGTWSIANGYATSSDGTTWIGHTREGAMQLAIDATLIPEPTTGGLLGLGLTALCLWPNIRKRKRPCWGSA